MLNTLSDLYPLLLTILAFDGLLMAFLLWAVTSKRYGKYRIRTPATYRIPNKEHQYEYGPFTRFVACNTVSVSRVFSE